MTHSSCMILDHAGDFAIILGLCIQSSLLISVLLVSEYGDPCCAGYCEYVFVHLLCILCSWVWAAARSQTDTFSNFKTIQVV